MCFSAEASFIASGALAVTGAYTVKKTLDKKKHSFLLAAAIPLLFSAQQLIEGFIWVFAGKDPKIDYTLSCLYLFFAFFLWPVWIPLTFAIYDKGKKKIYGFLAMIGFIYGSYVYILNLFYRSNFNLHMCEKNICYFKFDTPNSFSSIILIYFVCTILPFFISRPPLLKLYGVIISITAMISTYFYVYAFYSVWCFFSAICSIYIIYLVNHFNKIKIDY